MMSLKEYSVRLRRIWLFGFLGILLLVGAVKWKSRADGQAGSNTIADDIVVTVMVSLVIPTLVALRGYFRYKKFLKESSNSKAQPI